MKKIYMFVLGLMLLSSSCFAQANFQAAMQQVQENKFIQTLGLLVTEIMTSRTNYDSIKGEDYTSFISLNQVLARYSSSVSLEGEGNHFYLDFKRLPSKLCTKIVFSDLPKGAQLNEFAADSTNAASLCRNVPAIITLSF